MNKIIGFTCIMIAIGMLLMMFIEHTLVAFILVILLLIVGYNLFCC